MQSLKYIKRLKNFQRESLIELYEEHALYLLRAIKTGFTRVNNFQINNFKNSLSTYLQNATCHEVAINEAFGLEIETHQNHLGKEKEYTEHPDAQGVGRDLRVKLVWELIISALAEDTDLDFIESYSDSELNLNKEICCPFCHTTIGTYEKAMIGYHMDGTENWTYKLSDYTPCDCYLCVNDYSNFDYIDQITTLIELIQDHGDCEMDYHIMMELCEDTKLTERVYVDDTLGQEEDFILVVENWDDFYKTLISQLSEKYFYRKELKYRIFDYANRELFYQEIYIIPSEFKFH